VGDDAGQLRPCLGMAIPIDPLRLDASGKVHRPGFPDTAIGAGDGFKIWVHSEIGS